MEIANWFDCMGCGAHNDPADVFLDPCWKCGRGGVKPKVQTPEELNMCRDCKATDGYHTMNCPGDTWPPKSGT